MCAKLVKPLEISAHNAKSCFELESRTLLQECQYSKDIHNNYLAE